MKDLHVYKNQVHEFIFKISAHIVVEEKASRILHGFIYCDF